MDNSQLGTVLGEYLLPRLAKELLDQGHRLSGDLISSLEYKIKASTSVLAIDFLANAYGAAVNTGVPASSIPYTPGRRGGGGTSAYIQALIRYVQRRMGLQGKEATSVAFAIARKHSREGMPTGSSYEFSNNSRRTGWIDQILSDDEEKISEIVQEWVAQQFKVLIVNYTAQRAAA